MVVVWYRLCLVMFILLSSTREESYFYVVASHASSLQDSLQNKSKAEGSISIEAFRNGVNMHFRTRRLNKAVVSDDHCSDPNTPKARAPRKYFLGLGVVIKDEVDFVEEWARHYLSEGVQRIYMIDQESYMERQGPTNTKRNVLKLGGTARELESKLPNMTKHILSPPLASPEKVGEVLKKNKITHLSIANMPNMSPSYRALVNAAKGECKWLIFVDSDEYMYAASRKDTISSVVRRLSLKDPSYGQISVPWTFFGSSNHIKMPQCIVQSFTWSYQKDIVAVKSILRLDALRATAAPQVHRNPPQMLCPNWKSLNADGSVATSHPHAIKSVVTQQPLLKLNHYWYRSYQFALYRKACRSGPAAAAVNVSMLFETLSDIDHKSVECNTELAERQIYGGAGHQTTLPFSTASLSHSSASSTESSTGSLVGSSIESSNRRPKCPFISSHSSWLLEQEARSNNEESLFNLAKGVTIQSEVDKYRHQRKVTSNGGGSSGVVSGQNQVDEQALSELEKRTFVDLGPGCGLKVGTGEELRALLSRGVFQPASLERDSCKF